MSQRIAAIELSGDNAHAVVVEATLRKQVVENAVSVSRKEEETDEALLARLQEQLGGHFDSIALGCDASRVSARLLDGCSYSSGYCPEVFPLPCLSLPFLLQHALLHEQ